MKNERQTLRDILRPFARSIRIKSAALKNKALHLTEDQVARFRESISEDIRKCSDLFMPEVSEAAKSKADKRRPRVDLFLQRWQDQPKFDHGRVIFHFEHVTLVKQIREECLRCDSDEEVLKKLESIRIAWILKAENKTLDDLGYRNERPDPDKAYRDAKIKLINASHQ